MRIEIIGVLIATLFALSVTMAALLTKSPKGCVVVTTCKVGRG